MAEDLKNKQEELLEDELDKVAGGVAGGPKKGDNLEIIQG